MQKKAFTIIELTLIVAMLGLIFGMTRNFFNVSKQQKLIFGETCLNYVFGEIDKFQDGIKYGKLPVTISGQSGVYSIRFYGENTGTFLTSTGFAGISFEGIGNDLSTIVSYDHISLSSNNFAPLQNTPIPEQCLDGGLTLVGKSSITSGTLQVTIPAVKTNDTKWFVGENWVTNVNPQTTGEVVYSVCSRRNSQINPARGSALSTSECIQVGKVNIDKRSETINLLKCTRTNTQTGICSAWPRLN